MLRAWHSIIGKTFWTWLLVANCSLSAADEWGELAVMRGGEADPLATYRIEVGEQESSPTKKEISVFFHRVPTDDSRRPPATSTGFVVPQKVRLRYDEQGILRNGQVSWLGFLQNKHRADVWTFVLLTAMGLIPFELEESELVAGRENTIRYYVRSAEFQHSNEKGEQWVSTGFQHAGSRTVSATPEYAPLTTDAPVLLLEDTKRPTGFWQIQGVPAPANVMRTQIWFEGKLRAPGVCIISVMKRAGELENSASVLSDAFFVMRRKGQKESAALFAALDRYHARYRVLDPEVLGYDMAGEIKRGAFDLETALDKLGYVDGPREWQWRVEWSNNGYLVGKGSIKDRRNICDGTVPVAARDGLLRRLDFSWEKTVGHGEHDLALLESATIRRQRARKWGTGHFPFELANIEIRLRSELPAPTNVQKMRLARGTLGLLFALDGMPDTGRYSRKKGADPRTHHIVAFDEDSISLVYGDDRATFSLKDLFGGRDDIRELTLVWERRFLPRLGICPDELKARIVSENGELGMAIQPHIVRKGDFTLGGSSFFWNAPCEAMYIEKSLAQSGKNDAPALTHIALARESPSAGQIRNAIIASAMLREMKRDRKTTVPDRIAVEKQWEDYEIDKRIEGQLTEEDKKRLTETLHVINQARYAWVVSTDHAEKDRLQWSSIQAFLPAEMQDFNRLLRPANGEYVLGTVYDPIRYVGPSEQRNSEP
jgi:hypothetical protein